MTAPMFHGCFPHRWTAEILPRRPMIVPRRHYIYPADVEEVEKGALEVLVQPAGPRDEPPGDQFLATCALGFRDEAAPTGLWAMPDPNWLCAVSGGYAYLIDTAQPEQFTHLRYRPVLAVHSVRSGEYRREHSQSLSRKAQSGSDDAQSLHDVAQSASDDSQSASGGTLLFVGHHSILAWGKHGEAWESERLSWEGITIDSVEDCLEDEILYGRGWDLRTDQDLPFALDLRTGKRI
jgi:hypothetical protein